MFDPTVEARLLDLAERTPGFLPASEGVVLFECALHAAAGGPLLEIGSYCGKSALYLGAAARRAGTVLFSVDHHRGSEDQQPGQLYHDPAHLDPVTGLMDTLPAFRQTIARAGLESVVIAIVGESSMLAANWESPLGFLFIDGGHSESAAAADYAGWAPKLISGGLLAIHDVFADLSEGGQAPRHIYEAALASGQFKDVRAQGSLRVLRREVRDAGSGG